VLADVGCGSDDFTFGNIVVFDIDNLEQVTDIRIVVDNFADLVDEVDDSLPSR